MSIETKIREVAIDFSERLKERIEKRVEEMRDDDTSHFLIYRVLGITDKEGDLIDVYQNKGRFLYRYAGGFLEKVAKLCFQEKFPEADSIRIPNTESRRPKTFEVDCLIGKDAIEIKWRDATTDGDHITKEHTRIRTVAEAGYKPIRVMFYYPNRDQAIRIQKTLETLYTGVGGEYHYGNDAWQYITQRSGIDLKAILYKLADENTNTS
ncbi:MAG: ApaLI family restriction endonuclease [Chloroflexi bacterium]|nr:ApaLI family restriction endonuclease [Chloroflexota bacterium]